MLKTVNPVLISHSLQIHSFFKKVCHMSKIIAIDKYMGTSAVLQN